MFPKSVALILAVAVACSAAPQATRYPAGVDPHACPNYPNCDNVALAASITGQHQPHAAHYTAPYAAPSYSAYAPPSSGVPRAADAYPAGVDASVCPNFPFCGPTPTAPQRSWTGPQADSWAAPAPAAPQPSWGAPSHAPGTNWAVQALRNTWPGSSAAPQNNWAAPQNNWAAPQNNWAAPAPAAHSNWAAQAPAGHGQPAAAQYPAGVDPHACPNYPYCS